ncbi:MAG TPA: oligosaccharide flippase family protein, partial [Thermoplasmataceae archaeon]|nr:oligosaccharide flippase family protein [Thermoplasmataceae archaeon]
MNLLRIEKQDAAKGALYQYVSTAVTFLSGILFYVFLAKAFPTAVVGEMSLILAIATIMNIVFTLGLQNGAQHFLSYFMARNEHGKAYWLVLQLIIYGLLLALGGSFLTYALSYYIADLFFHSSALGYVVHYLAFELFFMISFNIFNGILLGLQSFRLSAIVSVFGQSLSYVFSFVLIFLFRQVQFAILGLAIGYGISVFVSLAVILRTLSANRQKRYAAYVGPVFSYSMPILFSSIIGYGSTY